MDNNLNARHWIPVYQCLGVTGKKYCEITLKHTDSVQSGTTSVQSVYALDTK